MEGFLGKTIYSLGRQSIESIDHEVLDASVPRMSTWAMFFNSSSTVSMMALFLSKSLSDTLIKAPFMLFFSLVINYIPSTKRRWNKSLPIYSLSPTSLP